MADREIERRFADILEELRIQRATFERRFEVASAAEHARHEEAMAGHAEFRAALEEQFVEMRAVRATSDLQTEELRVLSRAGAARTDALEEQTVQMREQTAQMREITRTLALQNDALRMLLDRTDDD